MKSTSQYRTQLEAAYALLSEDTTSLDKFEKIKTLISGIHPELDKKLEAASAALGHLKALVGSDIIHFATQSLSEKTPAEKKRKKALLFFITTWKSLRSEVKKVQGYASESGASQAPLAASAGKTVLFAKGPFGLITVAAVVIVGIGLLLRQASTTVTIENLGCPPLTVPELPFKISGLRLPESPILAGTPAPATLPALPMTVRASLSTLSATVLGQTGSYSLPARMQDISFDGASLLNKTTELNLRRSANHTLMIKCL